MSHNIMQHLLPDLVLAVDVDVRKWEAVGAEKLGPGESVGVVEVVEREEGAGVVVGDVVLGEEVPVRPGEVGVDVVGAFVGEDGDGEEGEEEEREHCGGGAGVGGSA